MEYGYPRRSRHPAGQVAADARSKRLWLILTYVAFLATSTVPVSVNTHADGAGKAEKGATWMSEPVRFDTAPVVRQGWAPCLRQDVLRQSLGTKALRTSRESVHRYVLAPCLASSHHSRSLLFWLAPQLLMQFLSRSQCEFVPDGR